MLRLNQREVREFELFLLQCTDDQIRHIYEKEKSVSNHPQEVQLVKIEAVSRGIDLD